MEIVLMSPAAIKPYDKNPRNNQPAVNAVAESIRRFGFRQPVVVDGDLVIVVGHTRWKAAKLLNLEEIPVHVARDLTPEAARAYRIADNKTNELAEWDDELLKGELAALISCDIDLTGVGFSADEWAKLTEIPVVGGSDPDEIPVAPQNPVTVPGNVWILGQHRLMCGNSENPTDVAKLLNDQKPTMMVTDPPYGVNYDPTWRKEAKVNNSDRMGKVQNDDRADWTEAYRLFPGDVAYVWHAGLHAGLVGENLKTVGFDLRSQIIWSKNRFALGRSDFHWQHEPCWYAVRKGKKANWTGDRSQNTIWSVVERQDVETIHSTQKPVECMARPMRNHGTFGDLIYEPFCGSGTTLIAAEMTRRICYAMELDRLYVDVAVARWEKFTGQKARLEGCSV